MSVLDANPNGKDADGNPYLLTVCENQDAELSNLLINFECNVNAANDDGTTALHMAAKVGNADLAGLLLASGADVNAVDSLGETPLIRGLYSEPSEELFNILLIDTDINAGNADFKTALHIAVHMNLVKEAMVLIQNGANVNLVDINGNTPLHCACQYNTHVPNPKMIKLLLSSKCDPNIGTRHQLTPLHMVATRETGMETMKILLEWPGVSLEARNELEQTPLFAAVHVKAFENVKELLKANCDVNTRAYSTQYGNCSKLLSVLDLALKLGEPRIICALFIAGATEYASNSVCFDTFLSQQSETHKHALQVLFKKPLPLKQLSRIAIRRALGRQPQHKIASVSSLPPALKDFVALVELDNV